MSMPADAGAVLDVLKSFLAEHPELVPDLVKAAEPAVAKVPLTIHDLFHDLVDHIKGIDPERAAQYHEVIDAHAAAPAAAAAPAPSPAPAEPEVTPAGSEPPAPAPPPVPVNLVVATTPATPAS